MKTYGVKYLGSKNKIIRFIIDMIGDEHLHVDDAIDVFTGTTRVAQALRQGNRIVHTSDLSWASEAYAYTFVHNRNNHHLQKYIGE